MHNDSFILWEHGGTGTGAFVGFQGWVFSFTQVTVVKMNQLQVHQVDNGIAGCPLLTFKQVVTQMGLLHEVNWDMRVGDGKFLGKSKLWIDGNLWGVKYDRHKFTARSGTWTGTWR